MDGMLVSHNPPGMEGGKELIEMKQKKCKVGLNGYTRALQADTLENLSQSPLHWTPKSTFLLTDEVLVIPILLRWEGRKNLQHWKKKCKLIKENSSTTEISLDS